MIITHLGHTDFNVIMECFLSSFEGYFVKMPTDYNYYKQRWKAAGVNFELSYGMFDDDKLVGFIIHAIDERGGALTAFNTGTGVIPDYRGKRIVKSIYNYAIPELLKNHNPLIVKYHIWLNILIIAFPLGISIVLILT